jgi:lipooligosaccharide transport system permease protein
MSGSSSTLPEPVEGRLGRLGDRPGARPRRWGSFYVAEHRIRSMRAYLQTLVVTALGNPLLYLFGLGVGLARLVTTPIGDGGSTVSYLAFVAPALLASAAVTVASEECTYPVLMGFKWNPIFYAMNAAPISGLQIVNGLVIGVAVRMLPTVVVYYAFMLVFGAVPSALGALGILVALLTGMSVGLLIMAYTSTIVEDRGQMALIQRFGIMPMFLFSGTFFPLTSLPVYLQWIGWISPLWHGSQLGRVLSYGMAEPSWLTAVHVAYPLALGAFGWWSTARTVVRRLNA